ncbi:MAG: GDP-mannose 4,6-dehydratase [Patescibacteria group bacterium]
MNILITGSAGFIGFHTAKKLLERGDNVIGIDNFNDYYDVSLKEARNKILETFPNFKLYRLDFSDLKRLEQVFKSEKIEKICHLGAQAGVRYSLENPHAYEITNISGTLNLLEMARNYKIKDFVFASSSSVYGDNKKVPFSESDNVDNPISIYAATKKADELMAYTYHHLYGLNCTGLRFFTVYGPWGRPDMALFKFIKLITAGKEIPVYGNGQHKRDFTYIEDIISGVLSAIDNPFGYEIINLGNNQPITLKYFIEIIEKELNQKASKKMLPKQPGDVDETYADIIKAKKLLNYEPKTSIEDGVKKFIEWYKEYYKI